MSVIRWSWSRGEAIAITASRPAVPISSILTKARPIRWGASVCSRTGLLAHRYYDRFFLGHPSVLYDASIQPVTLDTMVDVLAHDGAEADAMASDDPDVGVRCAVIELFAWWEYSPEVVRQIRRISRSDPDIVVREQAERYLERKDERSRNAPPYRTVADRGFSHPSNRKQRK